MKRRILAMVVKRTGVPIAWLSLGIVSPAQSADRLVEQCSNLIKATKANEPWNPDRGWEFSCNSSEIESDESVGIVRTATSDWPSSESLGPHPWPQLKVECEIGTENPIVEFRFWKAVASRTPGKKQVILAWDGESPVLDTA
ncbi:hypothetical protein [Bradyrhizobium cajani]|uniref:Uncharacterized protein n=1 Tax=Bradyrhizobium cajani TaxID=1928661 RepID=A0A844T6F9_9BRAD|nr:hypothetical protein [Bradyrhizobium cajani]MCP3367760.1 hypothetical protein [Bradyrhizobium cajani]MVT73806.1 hypothetical protein [Bradyrhizobium cajani]